MDGLNDQSLLDVRKLISGKDGRLFVTTKAGTNLFLAEVDTFQAQISPTNTDYQPMAGFSEFSSISGVALTQKLQERLIISPGVRFCKSIVPSGTQLPMRTAHSGMTSMLPTRWG